MRVFNYKEFYSAYRKGYVEKSVTKVSAVLFKPLFDPAELIDDAKVPYTVYFLLWEKAVTIVQN